MIADFTNPSTLALLRFVKSHLFLMESCCCFYLCIYLLIYFHNGHSWQALPDSITQPHTFNWLHICISMHMYITLGLKALFGWGLSTRLWPAFDFVSYRTFIIWVKEMQSYDNCVKWLVNLLVAKTQDWTHKQIDPFHKAWHFKESYWEEWSCI